MLKDHRKDEYKDKDYTVGFAQVSSCKDGTCSAEVRRLLPKDRRISLVGDSLTFKGFDMKEITRLKQLISSFYGLLYRRVRPEWKTEIFMGDVRIGELVHHPSCAHVFIFDVNGSAIPVE